MYLADLHIHSKYSRATSADCDAPHLDLWARYKGIRLIGTGDFTHAKWREELTEMLEPAGEGLYRLKTEYRLPCRVEGGEDPLFAVSGEISTIYKRDGKTRKVHHVILLPGMEEAEEVSHRLEAIGNLHSDGRPILGLDSHDLLEIVLEACPGAIYIPAHIWTPHFSLFGAFSGFDALEECFGDLTPYVHALETGLSSDPPMNRRLSALDGHPLVSNSDAHSPAKLGREANLLSCAPAFSALKTAVDTGVGLEGTIEFYPEEGKYHLDGHRNCHCRLTPEETARYGGICPVCGKKITIGVLNRVEQLADRKEPGPLDRPFESLMPLPEVIGETLGVSASSKKVQAMYFDLLEKLGPEFAILRDRPAEDAERVGGPLLAEALRRLRRDEVYREGGYDGEYGVIRLFRPGEREEWLGQTALFPAADWAEAAPAAAASFPQAQEQAAEKAAAPRMMSPNPEQMEAIQSDARVLAVIAGPGTGKTGTLVRRIAYLISEKDVSPRDITAVTFTRQAAREILERLEKELGKKTIRGLTVGTFHGICLTLLKKKPLISRETALETVAELLTQRGDKIRPAQALSWISAAKNGLDTPDLPVGLLEQYRERLSEMGVRDLDDVLLEALSIPADRRMFRHVLVDEYQDINGVQRALVRHWAQDRHLFVIGDPDQSIYGFRGADAGCFDALLRDAPDARVIRLKRNYRSSSPVVDAALSVISHNPGAGRELTAVRPEGPAVRIVQAGDEECEGIWIAKEIARLTGGMDMLEAAAGERGARAFSEIAVLCRTHRQLERLERYMNHDGIPCVVTGRGAFLETEGPRALIAFWEAMREPDDFAALRTALTGLFHCPAGLIQRAGEAMARMEHMDAALLGEELSPYDGLTPFREAVEALLPLMAREKPRKMIEALAQRTGVSGREVDQLLNTAVFYSRMEDFLDALQWGEEGDILRLSGGKPSGAVRLMTLHGAKGLEFPTVILAGLEKGQMPQERDGSSLEEERRLFFVGITRAREELILTCGGEPSSFLKEVKGAEWIHLPARSRPVRTQQMSLF